MLTVFNQYPTFLVFLAVVFAMVVTMVLTPLWIKFLKSSHIGQQVRADGPESHLVKQGTPTMGGVIMLVAALAMIFLVKSAILYFIIFGVILSVSTIMVGQISVQSTIGQWFVAKRGVAMAVTMGIGGLASFIAPLVVNSIIGASGGAWQSGWYLIAVFAVISIPLALFVVKNKPADVNQVPDGSAPDASAEGAKKPLKVYKNTGTVEYRQAIRSPFFWLIAVGGAGGFCAFSLATSQGVIHFSALGFDTGTIVGAGSRGMYLKAAYRAAWSSFSAMTSTSSPEATKSMTLGRERERRSSAV